MGRPSLPICSIHLKHWLTPYYSRSFNGVPGKLVGFRRSPRDFINNTPRFATVVLSKMLSFVFIECLFPLFLFEPCILMIGTRVYFYYEKLFVDP